MAKKISHLPKSFPIKLRVGKVFITDPLYGHHEQFNVTANGFEIGRFMEPISAEEYIKFLTATHFRTFLDSEEGKKAYEVIFLAGERENLKAEIGTKDQGIIVRDSQDKQRVD